MPAVDEADDSGATGSRKVLFLREPFLSAPCWSEDRSEWYPSIRARATMRLPNDPLHFVGGSWRCYGEERAATRAWSLAKGILLGRFRCVAPRCIELHRGLVADGER